MSFCDMELTEVEPSLKALKVDVSVRFLKPMAQFPKQFCSMN